MSKIMKVVTPGACSSLSETMYIEKPDCEKVCKVAHENMFITTDMIQKQVLLGCEDGFTPTDESLVSGWLATHEGEILVTECENDLYYPFKV